MKVYRIEREKYLSTTLQGIGAALSKGFRWNSQNTYLVYTAATRALAMLEVAVHLDLSEDLPNDRYYVEIEIPDEVTILELAKEDLPKQWDAKPPLLETQYIGDDFVRSNSAAVLKVPSSIVPPEYNYLINPNHTEASKIRVVSTQKLAFDNRLRGK
ncbi:RES family NAD+ phosphorylase [Flectobacillus sp. DC10W]|jgi:RES domain-containing protein|uniref:RES family NAD+ phosphorylase n=1 Tax=Flectobacillus longus TaxID=2984207 RepID=A0ABT6YPJ7_9BACT|nr:RES family NAD+ phosphorylase [Flectobacillus longus]MDI9865522.1 RES family NAD+ phosphorylase [Flectobacillus longus]